MKTLLIEAIPEIIDQFCIAARNGNLVLAPDFHSIFSKETSRFTRYRTMERALRCIEFPHIANYSALFAQPKSEHLPGEGFFDAIKNQKPEIFKKYAGVLTVNQIMDDENIEIRHLITEHEREIVFEHAEENKRYWTLLDL